MHLTICNQQSDFQVQRTPVIFSTVFLLCFRAYTLPDLRNSDFPEGPTHVEFFAFGNLMYSYGQTRMYIEGSPAEIRTPTT
jgi:hypothetical protein